jgi:hypothetical protein
MIRENLSNFFKHWQLDKDNATEILGENKKYNADLKSGKIAGKSHPKDKKTYSLYNLSSASVISKGLPELFHDKAGIPKRKYKIQGSIGQGNPAEIPRNIIFFLIFYYTKSHAK